MKDQMACNEADLLLHPQSWYGDKRVKRAEVGGSMQKWGVCSGMTCSVCMCGDLTMKVDIIMLYPWQVHKLKPRYVGHHAGYQNMSWTHTVQKDMRHEQDEGAENQTYKTLTSCIAIEHIDCRSVTAFFFWYIELGLQDRSCIL